AVTMLAQTSNRQLKLPNNLHRSTDAVSRSRPAWPSANALRQLAFTQAHRPRRSNPHRFSIPRFPPLEVFRRRPPEYRAITVSGRHPKTFTIADLGGREFQPQTPVWSPYLFHFSPIFNERSVVVKPVSLTTSKSFPLHPQLQILLDLAP